jgi:FkbM family methyltransferase
MGARLMVSYAQNAEDVVLARGLGDRPCGFYVDVGAHHPVENSVTKHFYDQGWRGVNVEPVPHCLAELADARPRDVNLNCAVGSRRGTVELTVVGGWESLSTTDQAIADGYDAPTETIEAEVVPLDDLLEAHAEEEIDFLKVDVEGGEGDVLASVDLGRWRPTVVVVEATLPCSTVPSHADWEPLVLGAGYEPALFDGLNRFYARADEPEVGERLAAPANVFDRYVPWSLWRWLDADAREQVERARLAAPALGRV